MQDVAAPACETLSSWNGQIALFSQYHMNVAGNLQPPSVNKEVCEQYYNGVLHYYERNVIRLPTQTINSLCEYYSST